MKRIHFPPEPSSARRWILALFALLIVLSAAIFALVGASLLGVATLAYETDAEGLTIQFGFARHKLLRSEVVDVRIVEAPTGRRRYFGVSVPGLYQGSWSFHQTGRLALYATDLGRLVVIELETPNGLKRFGISPADPEALVSAFTSGAAATFPAVRQSGAGLFAPFLLAVLVAIVPLVLLFRIVPIPSRLRYELAPGALRIHGPSRPIEVPYSQITAVELVRLKRRPLRVGGTHVPGFYWGRFFSREAGPGLYMCATRLDPLVIVVAGKRRYGLSPQDSEGFTAELRRRVAAIK